MNTVTFYNKNEEVHILFTENKIVYNGEIHQIVTSINTITAARFSFKNYNCKINRDILTVTDSNGISKTFFLKNQTYKQETTSEWDTYIIYAGNYISINSNKTFIKLNNELIKVKEVKKYGIFIEYVTDKGTLSLSSKNQQWKNITIQKSEK